MPQNEPNPRQTLVVLLGASLFPRAPKIAQGQAFYNSAQGFNEYLMASDGLSLPSENIKWLFNDNRSPSDQLLDIGGFLEGRSVDLKNNGTPPQDLIVYYVGHGLFSGSDQSYCLAIQATTERDEALTSIRVSDLASILKSRARFVRKFLIMDCCFSAASFKEFQSSPLEVSRIKFRDEFPQRGTALLCSASAQNYSLAPEGLARTMFSDSLLKSLRQGHALLGPRLSLSELGDLVETHIREAYPDIWVRPEVHSPDQREGDVASVPLFPNAACVKQRTEAVRQTAETEQEALTKAAEIRFRLRSAVSSPYEVSIIADGKVLCIVRQGEEVAVAVAVAKVTIYARVYWVGRDLSGPSGGYTEYHFGRSEKMIVQLRPFARYIASVDASRLHSEWVTAFSLIGILFRSVFRIEEKINTSDEETWPPTIKISFDPA
jgi:hypothetical protein